MIMQYDSTCQARLTKYLREKEIIHMKATAMTMTNRVAMKQQVKEGKLSLKERFSRYMDEYGIQITCGLMALNGDCNAYRTYTDLTRAR